MPDCNILCVASYRTYKIRCKNRSIRYTVDRSVQLIRGRIGCQHLAEMFVWHASSDELVFREHAVLVLVHFRKYFHSPFLGRVARVGGDQWRADHVVYRLQNDTPLRKVMSTFSARKRRKSLLRHSSENEKTEFYMHPVPLFAFIFEETVCSRYRLARRNNGYK